MAVVVVSKRGRRRADERARTIIGLDLSHAAPWEARMAIGWPT